MMLHKNKKLSIHTTIEDMNGKKIEAMTIFTMSIKYLKDHLLEALMKQTTGVEEGDIMYVITVPAIWDDSAKQFMRESAVQAGIDTNRLKLALEPEAASIWCQEVTEEAKSALAGSETEYMVVDLGGGTADITVHEKLADGSLMELHKASGGPWGGMYVDDNYLAWLENLFGKKAMDQFKMKNMEDYFDLLREFETKKRSITTKSTDAVTFRISAALRENSEKACDDASLEEQLNRLHLSNFVTIRRGKMKVDPEIIRKWFKEPVNSVVDHVKKILDEPSMKCVNTILLVGGFGESHYVHEVFKEMFTHQRLIVPVEAGLAVLKGAVRFGHEPKIVSSRVMNYKYGFAVDDYFDKSIHSVSDVKLVNGTIIVENVFKVFVRVGQKIATGQEVRQGGFKLQKGSTKSGIRVFNTLNPNPKFTTDPDYKKLGMLTVEYPEVTNQAEDSLEVIFVFGETELAVKARFEKTGRDFHTTIDCLQ